MVRSALAICLILAGLSVVSCDRAATDGTTGPARSSGAEILAPGVVFSADPNPVPPTDPKGRTMITWDTGSDAVGDVYVLDGGKEKLFASSPKGSQNAPWIQPGSNEFRLYSQTDHKLLARLNVTMAAASPSP